MKDEVRVRPFTVSKVESFSSTYIPGGVAMIEAPEFWGESDEGLGTVVAVLDTGIATKHPSLEGQIIGGKNFTTDYNGNDNMYEDNNGHGTHVAGVIAANYKGIVGVAPRTKLLVLKVLTGEGGGQYDWIIDAIYYASNWRGPKGEKVSVMNLSLGGPVDVPDLHKAIKYAVNDCDIPIVCATGNEGDADHDTFEYDYPASYNEVISVGAIGKNRKLADFSNVNEELDLVAPGVYILSAYLNNQFAYLSGTSMASPHVAGAVALLKIYSERAFGRTMNESELYAQLIKRTVPLEYSAPAVGNGLVQLKYMDKYRDLVRFIQTNFGDNRKHEADA